MNQRLPLFLPLFLLLSMLVLSGCAQGNGLGKAGPPLLTSKPVWTEVSLLAPPRNPALVQEAGDMVLDGLGEFIGASYIPDADRQILVMDWAENVLGFYIADLYGRKVHVLGGIEIRGGRPRLAASVWPQLLFYDQDDDGNRSWLLVDLAGEEPEIIWQGYAWVPPGLRREPVWFGGENWYMGPVTGPAITRIPSGETAAGRPDYEVLNPVTETWPLWAGGVSNSSWYMYPVRDGGCALLDIETGREHLVTKCQELAWNEERTLLAWAEDGQVGVLDAQGKNVALIIQGWSGQICWSETGNSLYYLGGEENFLGVTWEALWRWEEETGVRRLASLPGTWNKWRLLRATEEAVLAAAGGNGETLFYFDVANEKIYELKDVEQWLWQAGVLIFLRQGELLRLSPGFDTRIILRDAGECTLLGLVNRFVLYTLHGKVYIRQLAM